MSDIDDDLLELADVGAESPASPASPGSPGSPAGEEDGNPYPLEGQYRDAADRARLDALPEIEREEILYERAQEMQRYEERRYLAQRRKQMVRPADSDDEDVPAAKRQRGTTGVTTGTKSSLEALKSRRQQQKKRYEDSEYEESGSDDDDSDTGGRRRVYDSDSEDEEIRRGFRGARTAEYDDDASEAQQLASQPITLSDANKIRWGKSLFARFCLTPGFAEAVPGCFVRVNVGAGRNGAPVYRLCQIVRVVPHRRYRLNDQVVDAAVVASMAGSERTLEFGICSDSPATPPEFDYWAEAMAKADLTLPSRRRAQLVFNGVRQLGKRVLTSEEIDEMVRRRAELNGQRGANAVLAKAELVHQREIAYDQGDTELVKEIDAKLNLRPSSGGNASTGDNAQDKLVRVNERNKRANVTSVRKAEVQAHTERRKAGATGQSDPFSRLRTTARVFYKSDAKPEADQSAAKAAAELRESAKAAKQLQTADVSMPLGAVDDLIARIDIKLDIDI